MKTKPFNRVLYEMFLHLSNRILRTICVVALLGVNPASAEETKSLSIESPAFPYGGAIPVRYTCKGEDISPALSWSGVPEGALSLVLIVDDPDAPDPRAPRMTWVHWVLYNIPPDATSLPEGVSPDRLPAGTKEGINDWKRTEYDGPCPPIGRHRYFYKLYALDLELEDVKTSNKARIEAAMRGHVIARAELVGTFEK